MVLLDVSRSMRDRAFAEPPAPPPAAGEAVSVLVRGLPPDWDERNLAAFAAGRAAGPPPRRVVVIKDQVGSHAWLRSR